LFYVNII